MTSSLTFEDVEYLVGLINAQGTDEPVILTAEERDQVQLWLSYALEWPVESSPKRERERRAARLYCAIVTGRPLRDGNKRLALMVTAAFLIAEGFLPSWSSQEMYEIATREDGNPRELPRIFSDLIRLISRNTQPLTDENADSAATPIAA